MRHVNRPIFWMLMAIFVAQGAFPGIVVCVSDNGHVAIEMPHEPCCSGDIDRHARSSHHPSEKAEMSPEHDDCGPCTDVAVSRNLFRGPDPETNTGANTEQIVSMVFDFSTTPVTMFSSSRFATGGLYPRVDETTELPATVIRTGY